MFIYDADDGNFPHFIVLTCKKHNTNEGMEKR